MPLLFVYLDTITGAYIFGSEKNKDTCKFIKVTFSYNEKVLMWRFREESLPLPFLFHFTVLPSDQPKLERILAILSVIV